MYSKGDIISSVCHGGAIFPGVIDESTGKSIIAGRKVTGFTTQGEIEEGVLDTIKSWDRPTIEAAAGSAGATCELVDEQPKQHILTANRYPTPFPLGGVCANRWEDCYWCQPSKCEGHC